MLELKIFVLIQTFRRRPFMPSHKFCHPACLRNISRGSILIKGVHHEQCDVQEDHCGVTIEGGWSILRKNTQHFIQSVQYFVLKKGIFSNSVVQSYYALQCSPEMC